MLDLQVLVHRVYDDAYYKDYVYLSDPRPPLTAEDKAWAAQWLTPPQA